MKIIYLKGNDYYIYDLALATNADDRAVSIWGCGVKIV